MPARRVSGADLPLSNFRTKTLDCGIPRSRPLRSSWSRRLLDAARLTLPQRCALCVAPAADGLLCNPCAADLPRIIGACPACALPAINGFCGACLAKPPPWSRATAAFVYAFPVDRLLVELKYRGQLALADWAGASLAARVEATLAARSDGAPPQYVSALPLASARQRERGFNQAREIARRVAHVLALPLATPLKRASGAIPQTALAWRDRARNVRGAFVVCDDVRGARIALVDDVMTTGATLAEATRTLLRAGAADVECWVVARTLPPGSTPGTR